jgi:hypothetical protein
VYKCDGVLVFLFEYLHESVYINQPPLQFGKYKDDLSSILFAFDADVLAASFVYTTSWYPCLY